MYLLSVIMVIRVTVVGNQTGYIKSGSSCGGNGTGSGDGGCSGMGLVVVVIVQALVLVVILETQIAYW